MLQISYEGGTSDKSSTPIGPDELHPKLLYRFFEQYAGLHENGDPQPKSKILSGEKIKALVKAGALHALRDYQVQGSEAGTKRVLKHLGARVEKVIH